MFAWSDESISWYLAASEWTGYHARLAEEASYFLKPEDEVIDLGCGPGCLAVELAPHVRKVTAVDIDERVVETLRAGMKAREIDNIEPIVSDYNSLPENCCDVLVACSFGVLEKNAFSFMRLARKRMIVIKRKDPETAQEGVSGTYRRKYKDYDDEAYLDSLQIAYRLYTFGGDFGQPLRDREEALRYMAHYRFEGDTPIEELLDRCRIRDPGGRYRYYLPNKKEVHMLIIEKRDLMENSPL